MLKRPWDNSSDQKANHFYLDLVHVGYTPGYNYPFPIDVPATLGFLDKNSVFVDEVCESGGSRAPETLPLLRASELNVS